MDIDKKTIKELYKNIYFNNLRGVEKFINDYPHVSMNLHKYHYPICRIRPAMRKLIRSHPVTAELLVEVDEIGRKQAKKIKDVIDISYNIDDVIKYVDELPYINNYAYLLKYFDKIFYELVEIYYESTYISHKSKIIE